MTTKTNSKLDLRQFGTALPEFANVGATAALPGLSAATVWRRLADGTSETVKDGARRRVRPFVRLDRRAA